MDSLYTPDLLVRVALIRGDITRCAVDAVVNAANTTLLGGGGVDGAIHKAAGPQLLEECRTLGGCETGDAKVTRGYNLEASWVIHTPGPVWKGGHQGEPGFLRSCYVRSLEEVRRLQCVSVAFPAISCGVYGYPPEKACPLALETVLSFLHRNALPRRVDLVCFGGEIFRIYSGLLSS